MLHDMICPVVRGSDGNYYRQDNSKFFLGVALFFGVLWILPTFFSWLTAVLTYTFAGIAYYLIFKVLQFVYRFVRKQIRQQGE